jgi:acetyl-CoA carboxylase biotin carboxyl carrier protein
MKQISAMMAGIVVKILVKEGDQIKEGEDVAVLESMKMELPIQSNLAGKISQVKVKDGDFVNEGDVLLLVE